MKEEKFAFEAKGHIAKVLRFDTETAMLPLNANEARWLSNILRKQIERLTSTGDFPEKEKYENLLNNLITAEEVALNLSFYR